MTLQDALPLPVIDHASLLRNEQPRKAGPLRDPVGRGIGYLRLSLTSACAMRCTYCRPSTHNNPRDEARLTPDEIGRLVGHLAERHGVTKVRLTGGDPTSRPDLVKVIGRVASVGKITDLAMTTNGLTLERMAGRYRDAGLGRVNISLDSLDRQRFAGMTGVDGLERVLAGIDAAASAGLGPIKLNTVVVRGENEGELAGLVGFAAERGVEVRFIELMPMGPLASDWHGRYVPAAEVKARLSETMRFDSRLPQGHDAARRYRVSLADGRSATVGFITPMSCNFCAECNRVRIAADGKIYPCLMDQPAGSVLAGLRPGFDPDRVDACLAAALENKRAEHPASGPATMTELGG